MGAWDRQFAAHERHCERAGIDAASRTNEPTQENDMAEKKEKIARRGRINVERQFKNGQRFGEEHTETHDLEVQSFDTTPGSVSLKHGATINLGNYESARVDVMVTIPCYVEEVDDALAFAESLVTKFMDEQTKGIKGK